MIEPTWKCRYCSCMSYSSRLAVIHELHECPKNPRNLIKNESYFLKQDKKLSSTTTTRSSSSR